MAWIFNGSISNEDRTTQEYVCSRRETRMCEIAFHQNLKYQHLKIDHAGLVTNR